MRNYFLKRGLGGMNKKEIESLIYEYHWRKREVSRLENILYGTSDSYRSVGVAQYSVEATLPKPNTNLKSHAEMDAMDAREKRLLNRLKEYEEKVRTVEKMADYLTNDKHLIILDCMMEGMSYRSIAAHLGIGRTKIWEMKDEMLNTIITSQKGQNGQFERVRT